MILLYVVFFFLDRKCKLTNGQENISLLTIYIGNELQSQLIIGYGNKQKTCKIWGFHGGDYEEWRLLGYKTPVRTSQATHYVSATESNQIMLCKIWGFHGGDYEERRLLRYKNPVHTSQETHYISATESGQLILCKIWGFHGGDYKERLLLGYKNSVHT
jgi:hypothetical protein